MGSDWCLAELLIIYPESLLQSPRGGVVFHSWRWGLWAKEAIGEEEGAAELGPGPSSGTPFQMLLGVRAPFQMLLGVRGFPFPEGETEA